jgi:hypothetical protein
MIVVTSTVVSCLCLFHVPSLVIFSRDQISLSVTIACAVCPVEACQKLDSCLPSS